MRYYSSYSAEPSTMLWIEKYIKKGDVVWDIGANIGAYSLLAASLLREYGAGKVLAFEPESGNFFALNRNIQINRLQDWIEAVPVAIGSELALTKFYLSNKEIGSASHAMGRPESDGISFKAAHVQGIISVSIDELMRWKDIEPPNHIKIDVDGFEGYVIDGMVSYLKNPALKSVVIECAVELSKGQIERNLFHAGFELDFVDSWQSASGKVNNYLFSRK